MNLTQNTGELLVLRACVRNIVTWLACVLFACSRTWAVEAPKPAAQSFDTYKLVRSRNIFDPERRPIRTDAPRTTSAPVTRADFVTLTGTMVTGAKTLAFFSGSRSEYNKVLPLQEKIAEYTITAIAPTHVDLQRDGKTTVVAVGKPLPLSGSGTAVPAGQPADGAAAPAAEPSQPADAPASAPGAAAPAADPSAPPDKNEIIRRMMERRQKEVSR